MQVHRSIPLFFFTFLNIISLHAQENLISNPSFEQPPLRNGVYLHSDPVYIRSSANRPYSGVVSNEYFEKGCSDCYSIQKCHSGENCVELYNSASMRSSSDSRSVIQGRLISALQKDSIYYFGAYLSNSYANPYNTEIPVILLMDSVYSETNNLVLQNYQKIRIPIKRDSNWQKIRVSFTAHDHYRYFILGEVDEKSPVKRIKGERKFTPTTIIDDLWLSRDSSQIIEEESTDTSKMYEEKIFFGIGESEMMTKDRIFADLDKEGIVVDSVIIHSYTDGQGMEASNIALSALRSEAVKKLVQNRYNPAEKRIHTYNHGESACKIKDNPNCRYSRVKIYYRKKGSDREAEDNSNVKQFLRKIVMPNGDTVYVIDEELDYKVARRKREYRKAIEYTKQEKYKEKFLENERAELWSMLGECDSAIAILTRLFKTPTDGARDWIFSTASYLNCLDDPRFRALREEYVSTHMTDTIPYPNIMAMLWEAEIKDQAYSELIDSHEEFPEKHSAEIIDSLWKEKRAYHEENESLLRSLIDSIGWPTVAEVGKTASTAAFLIVQHSSDVSFQQEMLDIIKGYALAGEIPPGQYAYLADRVSYRTTGQQHFGTQVLKNYSDGTYKVAPYDDLETLLRNREKYQLGDWNAYLKRFGLEVEY